MLASSSMHYVSFDLHFDALEHVCITYIRFARDPMPTRFFFAVHFSRVRKKIHTHTHYNSFAIQFVWFAAISHHICHAWLLSRIAGSGSSITNAMGDDCVCRSFLLHFTNHIGDCVHIRQKYCSPFSSCLLLHFASCFRPESNLK